MIAYIKGFVNAVNEQSVVLDNQGVGFLINASPATLSRLPSKGEAAQLHTYLQVKEDGLALFGFLSTEELETFHLLISISGIGPKVALGILGVLTPAQISTAVLSEDAAAFSKAPGVGKKMAQRIALELQGKIESLGSERASQGTFSLPAQAASGEKQEALEALLALGYGRSEALRAVLEVATEEMPTQQILRLALKKLM